MNRMDIRLYAQNKLNLKLLNDVHISLSLKITFPKQRFRKKQYFYFYRAQRKSIIYG